VRGGTKAVVLGGNSMGFLLRARSLFLSLAMLLLSSVLVVRQLFESGIVNLNSCLKPVFDVVVAHGSLTTIGVDWRA